MEEGERMQRHMATGVRGQGAIQSNETAQGRKREGKRDEGWREGGSEGTEGEEGDRKYYIILCVPPQDHSNSLT